MTAVAKKGFFITLEGGEGAGKSTLARGLQQKFEEKNITVVMTREPGGTPKGEEIRKVLLSGAASKMGSMTEALLFAAARDEHLKEIIRPALEEDKVVICDRFADSTRVYQGYVGGVERQMIERMDKLIVGDTQPDLTFIVDIAPEKGLARVKLRAGRTDRFESEEIGFHRKIRAAFFDIASRFPERCIILDGEQTPDAMLEKAWNALAEHRGFAKE
ncbi:MAG: dTMP kinase [Pseudomonadota bacterium]